MTLFWLKIILRTLLCTAVGAISYEKTESRVLLPSVSTNNGTFLKNNNTVIFLQGLKFALKVELGTPPQSLWLELSLNSPLSWVATIGSTGYINQFNPASSTTYQNTTNPPTTLQMISGEFIMSGILGSDLSTLPNTIINVTQQIVFTQGADVFNHPILSGLLGLGYGNFYNFLDLAFQNGEIQTSDFILRFNVFQINGSQIQIDQMETSISLLYYNKLPQSITNNTLYVPVINVFNWEFDIISFQAGEIDLSSYLMSRTAIIATANAVLFFNNKLYQKIAQAFFYNCTMTAQNLPSCYCNQTSNWPTFSFMLDGIQIYFPPSYYIFQTDPTQNLCTYLIGFTSVSPIQYDIQFGYQILNLYNITFSKLNKRIGFSGKIKQLVKIIPFGKDSCQYFLLLLICLIALMGWLQYHRLVFLQYQQEINTQQIGQWPKDDKNILLHQLKNIQE